MPVFDMKNATVTLKDGAANELIIRIKEGQLSFTEHQNMNYVRDRGELANVMRGDEEPVDVKLDSIIEYFSAESGSVVPTPKEFLQRTGPAVAYTSSDADLCAPYAVDLEIELVNACGANSTETITIPDFRWESVDFNLKDGAFSIAGKANVTKVTAVRS
jgi:hypothetical protein